MARRFSLLRENLNAAGIFGAGELDRLGFGKGDVGRMDEAAAEFSAGGVDGQLEFVGTGIRDAGASGAVARTGDLERVSDRVFEIPLGEVDARIHGTGIVGD